MIRVKYFLLVLNLMHRRRHCPVEDKKREKKYIRLSTKIYRKLSKVGERRGKTYRAGGSMFPSAAEQSVVCLSVNCEVQRISRPKHSDFTLKCEKGG